MTNQSQKKPLYCIFCGSKKETAIGCITGANIDLDCACEKLFIMLSETLAGLHRAKKQAHDAYYIKETQESIDQIHDSVVRMKNCSVAVINILKAANQDFIYPKYFKEYY